MKKKLTRKIQVTLSVDMLDALDSLSNELGCTRAGLIAMYIGQGYKQMTLGQQAFEQVTNSIAAKVQQELSKEIKKELK